MKRAQNFLGRLGTRQELASAALLTASLFLILAGYYLLKTVREALILTEGGAEVKSYASAGQALILLFALPVFGWVANRVKGARLVAGIYAFFAANLAVFYAMGSAGPAIAIAFYLWLGVFSVVTIALFWGFSNDLYSNAQGQRLFPIIGIGASVGGFLGAGLAKKTAGVLEPHSVMLTGGALVIAAAALLAWARNVAGPRLAPVAGPKAADDAKDGFQLIARSKYLILIAAMVVLGNVVNSTGEFIIGKTVVEVSQQHSPEMRKEFITEFYGDYYMLVGVVGMIIQALAVAPIFRKWGVGGALLVLPLVALSGYAAMAALPLMWVMSAAKIAENSVDYSLQNTAKHALFLPTSEAVKYKAKATIDAFFYRFGDMLQAGLVLVGTTLSFSVTDFARMNIVAALIWLGVAVMAAREYQRRTQARLEPVAVRAQAPLRAAA